MVMIGNKMKRQQQPEYSDSDMYTFFHKTVLHGQFVYCFDVYHETTIDRNERKT